LNIINKPFYRKIHFLSVGARLQTCTCMFPTAVGVAHGFEAMASPTAKLRMFCYDWLHIFKLKDRFSLIRFVGEAAAHHLR